MFRCKGNGINCLISKLFILVIIATVNSCNSGPLSDESKEHVDKTDTTGVIFKYNNTLFTIPSPYQVTSCIQKSGLSYNQSLINSIENSTNYNTNFKKSLNIGVYGTDIGYLSMYKQTQELFNYFSVLKRLASELGLSSALDTESIKKVENNINNKDTLIQIISDTYYTFDSYLKTNNREETGVLIVAGGWIESLYLLSQYTVESMDRSVINKLGEQKHPLDNLIEILSPYYYYSKNHTELIDALVDLAYEFDGIIFNYKYSPPEVKPEEKLTVVNCKSNVIISEYHIRTISNKISSIRNKIIH